MSANPVLVSLLERVNRVMAANPEVRPGTVVRAARDAEQAIAAGPFFAFVQHHQPLPTDDEGLIGGAISEPLDLEELCGEMGIEIGDEERAAIRQVCELTHAAPHPDRAYYALAMLSGRRLRIDEVPDLDTYQRLKEAKGWGSLLATTRGPESRAHARALFIELFERLAGEPATAADHALIRTVLKVLRKMP